MFQHLAPVLCRKQGVVTMTDSISLQISERKSEISVKGKCPLTPACCFTYYWPLSYLLLISELIGRLCTKYTKFRFRLHLPCSFKSLPIFNAILATLIYEGAQPVTCHVTFQVSLFLKFQSCFKRMILVMHKHSSFQILKMRKKVP